MADIEAFIAKWKASDGAERANYALFLTELCDQIGVDHPDATGAQRANDYTFERGVKPRDSADITNPKRIDLYKRDARRALWRKPKRLTFLKRFARSAPRSPIAGDAHALRRRGLPREHFCVRVHHP